jgi:hypothetical protein
MTPAVIARTGFACRRDLVRPLFVFVVVCPFVRASAQPA